MGLLDDLKDKAEDFGEKAKDLGAKDKAETRRRPRTRLPTWSRT